MKKFHLIPFVFLLLTGILSAQILQPAKWSFRAEKINGKEFNLLFEAKIDPGWHIYSQFLPEGDGPVPTSFHFDSSANFNLIGKVEEGKPIVHFDSAFEKELSYFEGSVIFNQKISVTGSEPFSITGFLEFMMCDNARCLPPEEAPFEFRADDGNVTAIIKKAGMNKDEPDPGAVLPPVGSGSGSLWTIFFAGIIAGFLGLLTPCVFPMIPFTVSFFLNRNTSRAKGIYEAFYYSFSIIVIYVLVGFLFSKIFGADALREITSNMWFNLSVFLLFILFGISFLGAFELQFPASWTNKADRISERGGIFSVFFMALTLVLVSFSCTGPIIGALLVEAATAGENSGPLAGMTGFAVALGLPFGIFAAFPGWLKSLPKSGGWLNGVKVTLGIIIIAFSLKFLSQADLAYHWGILPREVFLAVWIILFTILGFYFLGKIKFSHDSDTPYVSVPRLFFSVVAFAFAVYMIPGMWGAPLNAINAFTPPLTTQNFNLTGSQPGIKNNDMNSPARKYTSLFHCPLNISCFFDYEEGMEYARKSGKPALVDFTGWSCVNCKKMEASVWSDSRVLNHLQNDFVLISLYVDDKTELPENEKYTSAVTGKKIKTIGNKWSDFQATRFKTNSQPYYAPLAHDEKILVPPAGYSSDVENYLNFLEKALQNFHNRN
ncbi:MAG: thioredoxin family protein [Bacteroidetes bacterium]|nr:thioredoxin family protein [Bacteroidota bacterium]